MIMSKIKVFLSRALNVRNGYLLGIVLMVLAFCVVTTSYAIFTASAERKGALNIVTGNLYSLITSESLNNDKQIVVNDGDSKSIEVALTNVNSIDAKFNFYYDSTSSNVEISCEASGDDCPGQEGYVIPKNGSEGDSKNFVIKITNNDSVPATITFGSNVGLASKPLAFPSAKSALIIGDQYPITTVDLVKKANSAVSTVSINANSASNQKNMYPFTHKDGVTDYRFIGTNPNNWIRFNDQDWRMIGVFEPENKNGVKELRIKLISEESIGTYSYDNKNASNGALDENGKANWSDSTLNYLLNPNHDGVGGSLYWNRQQGQCYLGANGATTNCNFTENGLNEDAKKLISEVKWNLGTTDTIENFVADDYYNFEKGQVVYPGYDNNFIGFVGLMTPSDYIYTYDQVVDVTKSWLYQKQKEWFISPVTNGTKVFTKIEDGNIEFASPASIDYQVRPVVYLNADIKIIAGDGTKNNPYQLQKVI